MIYVQMAACGLFNFLGSTTTSATAITTQRMFISRSLNKSPPVISQIIISFLGRKKGNEGGAAEQQQQQQKKFCNHYPLLCCLFIQISASTSSQNAFNPPPEGSSLSLVAFSEVVCYS